jgi:GT2 family glycosyltransferase
MEKAPSTAVIVCTRDRPEQLEGSLRAILASDFGPFELLVVDQSRDAGALKSISARLTDGRLRVIRDEGAGLSRARNAGIAASRSEFVVFTDDDCEPRADWLQRVVGALEGDESAGVVFGTVSPAPCDPRDGFIVGYAPLGRRRLRGRLAKRHDGGIGANMAFRRAALEAVGPFDELLGAGGYYPSCEDGDMAYRVLCAGWSLLHEPDAVVVHYGLRDWSSGSDLTRRTYMAVAAAYTKHARCGDPVGAFLVAHSAWLAAVNIAASAAKRRRPLGIRRLTAHATGIRRSFEMGVDRERRLYVRR